MISIFLFFTLLHISFFLSLAWLWRTMPEDTPASVSLPSVSLIIPIRNEAENISKLFACINKQNYPTHLLQVIIVDDHSTDEGIDKASILASECAFSVVLVKNQEHQHGKKQAITNAISVSTGTWILCTDADCQFNENWVKIMISTAIQSNNGFISGPVILKHQNFFQKLQAMEFMALNGYGAVTLANHHPTMCNGANMAYMKEVFEKVGGYEGNAHIPTGDDEFLLQKVSKINSYSLGFAVNRDAIVTTPAKMDVLSFYNQRIRWTSKWKFHKNVFIPISGILAFFDFSIGLLLLPLAILQDNFLLLILFVLRFLAQFVYITTINSFYRLKYNWLDFFALSFIYPLHAVILGIGSIFGRYKWKGRQY